MEAPPASDRFSDQAAVGIEPRAAWRDGDAEMADSIGIAVMGASGRMGRMLIDTMPTDRAHLIAVTEAGP
jgi:hypothetical protein